MGNPRKSNGNARRKLRDRMRAVGDPCWLCGKPIDYSLGMVRDPKTGRARPHPMSFVIDEVIPVSKVGSPLEWGNVKPAHWICNARRGDGTRTRRAAAPLPQPFDDPPCP